MIELDSYINAWKMDPWEQKEVIKILRVFG